MIAGFYQFSPVFGDKQANLNKVAEKLSDVKADLIVLPEFFNTGYLFTKEREVKEHSENIPDGLTTRTLIDISAKTGSFIVAGLPENDNGIFYNSAVLTGPEGYIAKYRKTHLFNEEKLFFTPGDIAYKVIDIGIAKIGILICFDWYFPEATRILALEGMQILCHPSNLVLPHCPRSMATRSLENRVFTLTCNRTGFEEKDGRKLSYIGTSQLLSPLGDLIINCNEFEDELKTAFIEPSEADNKNILGYNDLFKDRRVDLYKTLTRID